MPYSNPIDTSNPTCFLFLIDQSSSMLESMGGGGGQTKAEAVADSINSLLSNLVRRCVQGKTVRNRFFVGVLGYGKTVAPALGGSLTNRDLASIGDVALNPLRVEQRIPVEGGTAMQFPIWFDPQGAGKTPMCAVLEKARFILASFLLEHPDCYPPVVVNLTDGAASDGDPEDPADLVRDLSSTDGNVLLFNAHVSTKGGTAIMFPDTEDGLPGSFARRLFRMSSFLPPGMVDMARELGYPVNPGTRGFVYNADLNAVVQFMNIGTTVSAKNRPPLTSTRLETP